MVHPARRGSRARRDRPGRPDSNEVLLADGRRLPYDYLVIATGVEPRPDQTPGLFDGGEWRKSIFDFYTLDGAVALREALAGFGGGRLAVHMLANAALGEGVETHLFLTFWGFDMITKSRMRLWACRMSADMMHLTGDDLYEEVEGIINAADFIEKTDGAQLLFI
jgi:predicted peroxiredoxin